MKHPPALGEQVSLKCDGESAYITAYHIPQLTLELEGKEYRQDVYAAPITDHVLLGLDFLENHKCIVDLRNNRLTVDGTEMKATPKGSPSGEDMHVSRAFIHKRTVVPPNSITRITVKPEQCLSPDKQFVVEHLGSCKGLLVSAVVISGSGLVPLNVINDTDRYVTLKPGCHVANATEAYQCEAACAAPAGIVIRQLEGVSEGDLQQQLDKVKQLMPSHLKDLFSRSVVGLTLDRAAKVGVLLISYEDIFARHDLDIGCLEEVQHRIKTGDSAPVRQKVRRTPFGYEAEEKKHLQTLLEAGVIQLCESDWASAPAL